MKMINSRKVLALLMTCLLACMVWGCGKKVDPNKRTVVQDGDMISLDYTGYIDGKTFDGGGTGGFGMELEIGSGELIPGFEEGCIGHKIGESFDLTLTFPEDYHNEKLAGKEAVFKVKIMDILTEE